MLTLPLEGQVDSPETPEITEIIENFIKMTKYFTKLKDTLTNYVRKKYHFKKQQESNFPWFPGFRISCMVKNKNPETPEIDRKLSKSIKHPVLTVYRY